MNKKGHIRKHHQDKAGGSRLRRKMVLNEEKIQSENRHAFEHLNGLMMCVVPAEKARLFSSPRAMDSFLPFISVVQIF